MLISEIEVTGSSFNCSTYVCSGKSGVDQVFDLIMNKGDMFSIEDELPGFHDCEREGLLIRGFYSFVEPFEVECLEEGNTTKKLKKRLKSCEFVTDGTLLIVFGNNGAKKLLSFAISAITGEHVDLHEFEFEEINRAHLKMTTVKSVTVTNPKEKEIRKCRMSGDIEAYTEYNVIDPRNHGLSSVSGMIDTPMGAMTLTVGKKGQIKLGVKRGLILTWDLLQWVFDMIIGKHEQEAFSTERPAIKYLRDNYNAQPPEDGQSSGLDNHNSPLLGPE